MTHVLVFVSKLPGNSEIIVGKFLTGVLMEFFGSQWNLDEVLFKQFVVQFVLY